MASAAGATAPVLRRPPEFSTGAVPVGIRAAPLLVRFDVEASVPVDDFGLLQSIARIVALPAGLGSR